MIREVFAGGFSVVSRRGMVFAVMNAVSFGSFFVGAFLAEFRLFPAYWIPSEMEGEVGNLLFLGLYIFLLNLVVSGFGVVTLPGVLFFGLPVAVLTWRGVVWGFMLNWLSMDEFLWAMPTVVLEGEGYVLAGVAGVVLGLSWLKPDWVFGGEGLSRFEAFRRALKECMRIYVLVALVLLVAAVVEALTIAYVS